MSSRLPPLAGLQLAACLDKLGRREAALGARVETYAALVDRRWVQPPDAAEYYLERFEAEIGPACARLGATSPACSRYARARARRAGVLEQARQIETLGRELAPVLGWIHTDPSAAGMRLLHLRKSGRLAVARRATERSATAGAPVLALLLDVPTLLESALRAPGLERIRTGEVALRVSGPDGNLLYNRDSQPVEGPVLVDSLGEGLPDCKAVLRRQPPDSERGFLAARRNLYLALTALLLGLLLFGGFAVFRTVLQEAELVAVKSNLVSLVSHEFRNPIASIRTLVERLQAGYVTDAARKQQYFDVIAGELQRLTRLVNNFLDFSQIDAGRKAYHPIETDLPALLGEVLAPFEARASQQGFRIETSVEVPIPAVRVDRDAIAQAILNLLDNALKYSTRDKRIDVRVRHAGGVVLVEVKDHGDGIDTNDLPHVFEAAYRTSDAARRNVPGVGLGLAIVKHVMTRHGGDVTVDSAPDGTTFALRIPAPAPTDAVRAPGAVPAVR
jgi:signal transduction histidine kinase